MEYFNDRLPRNFFFAMNTMTSVEENKQQTIVPVVPVIDMVGVVDVGDDQQQDKQKEHAKQEERVKQFEDAEQLIHEQIKAINKNTRAVELMTKSLTDYMNYIDDDDDEDEEAVKKKKAKKKKKMTIEDYEIPDVLWHNGGTTNGLLMYLDGIGWSQRKDITDRFELPDHIYTDWFKEQKKKKIHDMTFHMRCYEAVVEDKKFYMDKFNADGFIDDMPEEPPSKKRRRSQ